MAEYIEREAAIEACCGGCNPAMCSCDCDEVAAIRAIPTADVQPVRHGRWIDEPIKGIRYHCSICSGRFDYTWRYCPNCGAKMDGGVDDA